MKPKTKVQNLKRTEKFIHTPLKKENNKGEDNFKLTVKRRGDSGN